VIRITSNHTVFDNPNHKFNCPYKTCNAWIYLEDDNPNTHSEEFKCPECGRKIEINTEVDVNYYVYKKRGDA